MKDIAEVNFLMNSVSAKLRYDLLLKLFSNKQKMQQKEKENTSRKRKYLGQKGKEIIK